MNAQAPSRAVRLYGTDEKVPDLQYISTGPMSVLFDGANLRDIRMHGEEVIRAVSFVIRDKDWATWAPVIEDLEITHDKDQFLITYHALSGDGVESFVYDVRIEGFASGKLSFSAHGESIDGLLTNRTGFVVLHPIKGISGSPAKIRHTDGSVTQGAFPDTINPVQPMKNLREITHTTPAGQQVSCLMEGDTFEMEDQRQWTDASYKTYVRPLALPWPYRIEPGESIKQKITLTILGPAPNISTPKKVTVRLGASTGMVVPPLGFGLQPEDAQATFENAQQLAALGAQHVICHFDPRRGHDANSLVAQIKAAHAIGADPWLEAVIESVDDDAAVAEVTALGKTVSDLGNPFPVMMVSPAPDLKCTLPGSPWPAAPDAHKLYAATRKAFPAAKIGGGMFSFFTELNRKRPPTKSLDLVTFTTAAIFHAGDDRSMMETLECLPHIVRTLPEITKGLPYTVGPSAIAMRDNPYGEAALNNPGNIRQAVNFNDPRQRGIMGAAWALGYFAAFARGGASAIAIGAPVGAFGVLSVPTDFPQQWFDEHGGLYPIWHLMRGMAHLAGEQIQALEISDTDKLCGIGVATSAGSELWLCNTQPREIIVHLPEISGSQVSSLSAKTFELATSRTELLDIMQPLDGSDVRLDAFEVMRILIPTGTTTCKANTKG